MPEVTRLTETSETEEGFRVVTESGGDEYRYEMRRDPDDEDLLRCVSKTVVSDDGTVEEREPEPTDAVREAMDERGYDVA